jgi:hypothetical protein
MRTVLWDTKPATIHAVNSIRSRPGCIVVVARIAIVPCPRDLDWYRYRYRVITDRQVIPVAMAGVARFCMLGRGLGELRGAARPNRLLQSV